MRFASRARASKLVRYFAMVGWLAMLSPTILAATQMAFADSYPAPDVDVIVRSCLAESPRLFQSRGVRHSPAAAQRFCLCSAEVIQKQIPLADYKGAGAILAEERAGHSLSNDQRPQLAEFQGVAKQVANRCGCLIKPPAHESYEELVKLPGECPRN